eukprot:CAMPEP_0178389758 /NCGR_PEP_ID=MMETSP0689_2-20121128/10291_1 /TAXON_ID=160604 /ORGANISM="Amphidinium massartii, Strain CS-259" /LENGTH=505 /DNA_ID=CAMNT_0020010237 /DNA_START=4 /DNA_END=1521 /DNA_ORIENTATION=-
MATGQSASAREALVGSDDTPPVASALREVVAILRIMLPIFMSMVSWVAMKVTDTAVVGHVSTDYLAAVALSDLWTSSTGVFIQSRVIGTFCGQAWGAGNKMLVGAWLQVAYAVLLTVMVPVWVCWGFTSQVLHAFKEPDKEADDAGYYAVVLALCLPVRVLFSQLTSFFSVQKIMRPSMLCSTFGMVTNLILSLVLVLGIGVPGWSGFGFKVIPWITTSVEYLQLLLLWFVYCKCLQLHRECWPGWSCSHLTRDRVTKYFKMYFPAACAIGSDFWRVSVIGSIASSMGEVNLGIFNAGYRICWMCLTLVGALGAAVGIQVSTALGKGQVGSVKKSCLVGTGMAFSVLVALALAVMIFPRELGSIFSKDPQVLDGFAECRVPLAAFAFFMNMSVQLEAIPMAAGRVNSVFYAGLVGSWIGQVPGVLIATRFWRNDLVGLYTGAAAGYALLVLLYGTITLRLDWNQVVREARERSEVPQVSQAASQEDGAGDATTSAESKDTSATAA